MLLFPPAKLNRFLHIVGRRPDGYHCLQTAFELIDWHDELNIEATTSGEITRIGGLSEVPAELDLTVRAARLLQPFASAGSGCTLTLCKKIPNGAGLGGGSADAAAVLMALNRLWDLHLDVATLSRLGLSLGADVPVFIGQQPAFAEGVGELLTALPFVQRHYAVIYPGVSLATGPMFAHSQLRRDCAPIRVTDYLSNAPTQNVFEPVALTQSAEVNDALTYLLAYFGNARLTGSGSAVFAQVSDRTAATAAFRDAPTRWNCRAVSSLTNWFDKQAVTG